MPRYTQVAIIPVLLAILVGCGGEAKEPGLATAGGEPSAATGAGPAAQPDDAAFKKCLEENGVDIDAFERGQNSTTDLPGLVEKCREFLPDGGELAKLSPEELMSVQQYARCMRSNGVPEFPDPGADGDFGPDWDGTKVLGTPAGEKANAVCGKELLSSGS
jgi:hypothetical protein